MDSRFVSVIRAHTTGCSRKMLNLPFNAENKQEQDEIESELQKISGMYGKSQRSAMEQLSKDMELKRKMRERLNKKKANK